MVKDRFPIPKLSEMKALVKKTMPRLLYHNFDHAIRVYSAATELSSTAGIAPLESKLLRIAALFHDVIFVPGAKDNEERSAEFASEYLLGKGVGDSQIDSVEGLILATKFPQKPENYLQELICDADLSYLGSNKFFEIGNRLKEEWGIKSENEWDKQIFEFLNSHRYFSEAARRLYNPQKLRNIHELERRLGLN